jgi:hypothetical protein
MSIAKKQITMSGLASADVDAWNQYIMNIRYIAELLDKDRLDQTYLTDGVVCDIWLASVVAKNLPNGSGQTSVLERMGPTLEQNCKSLFP